MLKAAFMQFGINQSNGEFAAVFWTARCWPLEHLTCLTGNGDPATFNYSLRVWAFSK
jgi:hypothetical protein